MVGEGAQQKRGRAGTRAGIMMQAVQRELRAGGALDALVQKNLEGRHRLVPERRGQGCTQLREAEQTLDRVPKPFDP